MILHGYEFKAVIFDMDGVLIDSEPLWKIAMSQAFEPIGSRLTAEDFQQTVGLRIDQVVRYWNLKEGWQLRDEAAVVDTILEGMERLIRENPYALEGVHEILDYFRQNGLLLSLATSSPKRLMETVLEVLQLGRYFDSVHSAEGLPLGKPHPEVYLNAASALTIAPTDCLVIEDSFNGVIAGKAARMQVVCIPEKTHYPNPKLAVADYRYASLLALLAELRAAN